MHKLASTPIKLDCFEIGDYNPDLCFFEHVEDEDIISSVTVKDIVEGEENNDCWESPSMIHWLESLRLKYLETKDKRYWKELVRWLPNGWLQTRTVTMNYENLRSICHQREGHKLTEWHSFVAWAKTLPYAEQLIFGQPVELK